MKKVAIYCRLSDEDKNKKNDFDESESIQNQKNILIKYTIDNGWQIYKIYSDDDYSGLDKDRPAFNEMINDAQNKKFDIILCKHQSRFTRDMELVEKYLHNKFPEWGIRFISVTDSVDTFDKSNKKSRQICGLVNEWYCEDISESIRAVFRSKQQQGKFIGSFAPYGYKKDAKDKHKLIIDDEAAEIVRLIFNWYMQGYGTQHIAYMLNEKLIPNPTKYKQLHGLKFMNSSAKDNFGLWNKTTVKRILKSETYIGNMVQHVMIKVNYKSKKLQNLKKSDWIIVPNTHEQIIDEVTFKAVQKRLESNIRSSGTGQMYLFAGKIRCMDCKSTMCKTTNTSGTSYLRCSLYAKFPKKQLCTNHAIRLDELEKIVATKVKYYINALCNDDNISSKLLQEKVICDKNKLMEKELNKIKREIEDRILALKNLYIDKVKGLISEEQFSEFNSIFTVEKNELINKKEKIEAEIENMNKDSSDVKRYFDLIDKYKDFTELSQGVVNELIDYIEIGQKNKESGEQKVKIHWNF